MSLEASAVVRERVRTIVLSPPDPIGFENSRQRSEFMYARFLICFPIFKRYLRLLFFYSKQSL